MAAIIPAILPKTRDELEETLARLARVPGISAIQIDLVDGRFAGPATWPYASGEALPSRIALLDRFEADIDLMVEDPEKAIGPWLDLGVHRLTLHLESLIDPARTLAAVKDRYGHETDGPRVFELGLALNMQTPLSRAAPHIPHIDYIQLMGIDTIGRQREPFDRKVIERVRELRKSHPTLVIQVDGGVTLEVARELLAAGADRLVVGHALLGAPDLGRAYDAFAHIGAEPPSRAREGALSDADIAALADKATEIRATVVEMLVAAGSGHTAGPLGMADIFAAFYFHILTHDPAKPDWPARDRLILSNGHIVPVRYAAMAHAGYFPIEECATLRKFGSRLQGHPERMRLPGLETTSGPLGSGLSQAAGMAYAFRMSSMLDVRRPTSDGTPNSGQSNVGRLTSNIRSRVYCVMSDGEQEEGNTWEAAMFAGKYKLHNLTAIMDRNNIQIDGMTEDVMPLEPIADKYRAFGWHVLEVSGHDLRAFIAAVEEAKAIYEKPTLIIAHTIPGKGVPEIEFDYHWHGKPPSKDEAARFLAELRTLSGRIASEHQ